MTINRSALNRKSATAMLQKVQAAATAKTQGNKDSRFWEPTVDSAGNGFAVIRFLPAKSEDGLPYVKNFKHGFKLGTKWFFEDCPTTIGDECPVCAANSKLWDTGLESNKTIVRNRKRKLSYVSNILVIKDPKNPESEGKVFLYRYGQKVFDKLSGAMNPPEEYGEQPRDPFGFFDGCVVKLKIKDKDDFRNYDDTVVEPATDLFDGDEDKLMVVLESMVSLEEFIDPKGFKSYAELETKFNKFMGITDAAVPDEGFKGHSEGAKEYGGDVTPASKAEPKKEAQPKAEAPAVTADGEDDDDMAFFKQLAES